MPEVEMSLIVKLASLAVHVDEMLSSGGTVADEIAIQGLLADPEVQGFLTQLGNMALLPVKR